MRERASLLDGSLDADAPTARFASAPEFPTEGTARDPRADRSSEVIHRPPENGLPETPGKETHERSR